MQQSIYRLLLIFGCNCLNFLYLCVCSYWVLMNDGALHFLIHVVLDFLLLLMGIFVSLYC
jgi:hypothetical protein